jgi:uncharacterized protein YecE (DUF72 family)
MADGGWRMGMSEAGGGYLRGVASIRVGTASWTDRTLVQSGWYPKGVNSAEERLRYYASRFSLVEADSTYYFLPTEQTVNAWRQRTPRRFVFDVKAFSLLTQHPTAAEALPPDAVPPGKSRVYLRHLDRHAVDDIWGQFVDTLKPLHRDHKLGAILFQFPPWFTIKRANKDYVLECVERCRPLPISVELRNATWFRDDTVAETLDFFRSHRVPLVSVDTPPGDRSAVPALDTATSKRLAVVRLHGRGGPRPGMSRPAAAGAYSYPRSDLEEWVGIVGRLAEQTRSVHVVFRNMYRDHAVRNAEQFEDLLRAAHLTTQRVAA